MRILTPAHAALHACCEPDLTGACRRGRYANECCVGCCEQPRSTLDDAVNITPASVPVYRNISGSALGSVPPCMRSGALIFL